MEKKIFLLFVIFSTAQGSGYPGDFVKSVLLSESEPFWGDPHFPRCYSRRNSEYKTAIVNFSLKIFEAANRLHTQLIGDRTFKWTAPKARKSANDLGNLLKDYQKNFSEKVQEKKIVDIKNLMKVYKNRIEEKDNKLFQDLLNLKDSTFWALYLGKIKEGERTVLDEINVVTEECKRIMTILKECVERKKS